MRAVRDESAASASRTERVISSEIKRGSRLTITSTYINNERGVTFKVIHL